MPNGGTSTERVKQPHHVVTSPYRPLAFNKLLEDLNPMIGSFLIKSRAARTQNIQMFGLNTQRSLPRSPSLPDETQDEDNQRGVAEGGEQRRGPAARGGRGVGVRIGLVGIRLRGGGGRGLGVRVGLVAGLRCFGARALLRGALHALPLARDGGAGCAGLARVGVVNAVAAAHGVVLHGADNRLLLARARAATLPRGLQAEATLVAAGVAGAGRSRLLGRRARQEAGEGDEESPPIGGQCHGGGRCRSVGLNGVGVC